MQTFPLVNRLVDYVLYYMNCTISVRLYREGILLTLTDLYVTAYKWQRDYAVKQNPQIQAYLEQIRHIREIQTTTDALTREMLNVEIDLIEAVITALRRQQG